MPNCTPSGYPTACYSIGSDTPVSDLEENSYEKLEYDKVE